MGRDGFTLKVREWPDLGVRRRAILSMGELDAGVQFMRPSRRGISVVGASSDHLVVDVTDADVPIRVGDELEFVASVRGHRLRLVELLRDLHGRVTGGPPPGAPADGSGSPGG